MTAQQMKEKFADSWQFPFGRWTRNAVPHFQQATHIPALQRRPLAFAYQTVREHSLPTTLSHRKVAKDKQKLCFGKKRKIHEKGITTQ